MKVSSNTILKIYSKKIKDINYKLKNNHLFIQFPGEIKLSVNSKILFDSLVNYKNIHLNSINLKNNLYAQIINNTTNISTDTKLYLKELSIDSNKIKNIDIKTMLKHNDKKDSLTYRINSEYKNFKPLIYGTIKNDSIFKISNMLKIATNLKTIKKLINKKTKINGMLNIKNRTSLSAKVQNINNINCKIKNILNIKSPKISSNKLTLKKSNITIPIYQNITLHDSIITLNRLNQRNNIKNSYIQHIYINYNKDTIQVEKCNFAPSISSTNLKISNINGYTTGGNFRSLLKINSKLKKVSINTKNMKSFNISSLLKLYIIKLGFEAKRINLDPSRGNGIENLVNMNFWLNISNIDINNFNSTLINSSVNFTNIGYNAAINLADKLYNKTREKNILYTKYAIKGGYGMEKLDFNIENNILNVTSYLRSDDRNILPFLIRIRPKKYEMINNLHVNELIKPYLEEF